MGNVEIYVLLLFAVIAGWVLGKFGSGTQSRPKKAKRDVQDIFRDYFVGLNYLLNDEPDEAIDTFIRALEVDSDTIETHLALGSLLRRRGKVDKAIKVHQTLLARPGLDNSFSDATRIQLSLDYIAAGLLDRAERLLKEILEDDRVSKWEALQHLITIYQTEKEWELAVEKSQSLLANPAFKKDAKTLSVAAHYCCELALIAIQAEHAGKARQYIKRAFSFDRKHTRTSLVLATLEQKLGNYQQAIKELVRARSIRPDYTHLVIEPLRECHQQLGIMAELEPLLARMHAESPHSELVLALARLKKEAQGAQVAFDFLGSQLAEHATLEGVKELLQLKIGVGSTQAESGLQDVPKILESLQNQRAAHQCTHCGYESRSLYWLCPSCQQWDTIGPRVEKVN